MYICYSNFSFPSMPSKKSSTHCNLEVSCRCRCKSLQLQWYINMTEYKIQDKVQRNYKIKYIQNKMKGFVSIFN